MGAALYTIGYEEHRLLESLVERVRLAGVLRVIDVRELPLSRRRGFSKSSLAEAFAQAGISYQHYRSLGNPKPYRQLYRDGDIAAGRAAYHSHLHGSSPQELDDLAETVSGTPTCLLCLEHEPDQCHRSVIADALQERRPGLQVVNL
jgi:uncharacterized protein (DUF488 family)